MEWTEHLLAWYEANKRDLPWRRTTEAYPVWISEIMLQQTRVEAVRGYWTRFLEALPTVEALATVEEDRLLKLWEGLGYYSRARNLKRAAQQIMERFGRRTAQRLCGIAVVARHWANIPRGRLRPSPSASPCRLSMETCCASWRACGTMRPISWTRLCAAPCGNTCVKSCRQSGRARSTRR